MLGAFLWLEQRLSGNPALAWPAADIQQEAEDADLSKKVLFSASKRLGVIKKQTTEGWTWRLPPLRSLSSPTTTIGESGGQGDLGEEGNLGEQGDLGNLTLLEGERAPRPQIPHRPQIPQIPQITQITLL